MPAKSDSEIETVAGNLIDEAEIEDDLEDLGSIDELLAETDQGWDIDAQVLTLKQAAAVGPQHDPSWPAAMRPPAPSRSVAIPTPYELAPSTVARQIAPWRCANIAPGSPRKRSSTCAP